MRKCPKCHYLINEEVLEVHECLDDVYDEIKGDLIESAADVQGEIPLDELELYGLAKMHNKGYELFDYDHSMDG